MPNIAIVGSRGFTDDLIIRRAIMRWREVSVPGTLTIVSGGARGADSIGEQVAKEFGIPTIVHLPQWDKYGKSAGFRRNELIVRDADIVLAFYAPGARSRGTAHTVSHAVITGKPVFTYHEGEWLSLAPRSSEEERTDARGVLDPAPIEDETTSEFD